MKPILFPLIAIIFFAASCDKTPTTEPVIPIDTPIVTPNPISPKYNRDSAIADYQKMYLGSQVSTISWNGNASVCKAGSVPQDVHDAVIMRINYYRKIVGLNYNCTLDNSLTEQMQETALIMTANTDLSHDPPSTWHCYTATGADGAKKSNLRLGSAGPDAVDAFMDDAESYNYDVGHRRWLLYSKQSAFAHGSTNNTTSIHISVERNNTQIPDYIAYPPANFIPREVVFNKWSFSIPDADFSAANVKVTHDGKDISCTVISNNAIFADNTIVWELDTPVPASITSDLKYKVSITNVKGAPESTYDYIVTVIKI